MSHLSDYATQGRKAPASAENKSVTARAFIDFRGPQALLDNIKVRPSPAGCDRNQDGARCAFVPSVCRAAHRTYAENAWTARYSGPSPCPPEKTSGEADFGGRSEW
jgi:hypothetical protein